MEREDIEKRIVRCLNLLDLDILDLFAKQGNDCLEVAEKIDRHFLRLKQALSEY